MYNSWTLHLCHISYATDLCYGTHIGNETSPMTTAFTLTFWDSCTCTNSVDPDQTALKEQSDLGLHFLLFLSGTLGTQPKSYKVSVHPVISSSAPILKVLTEN